MAYNDEQLRMQDRKGRSSLPHLLKGMRNVYCGFIGEKLSPDSPDEVWKTLRELDVNQIIDLRHRYNSEAFMARCQEYGISYYNYPIHNDPQTIASMVEKYPKFTELLCNGNFYMFGYDNACVALCLYWALSPSSGAYPDELRKEIKRDGERMKEVEAILYAMTEYAEEHYGSDMPAGTYERQREAIRDFMDNDYPKRATYSFVEFTRAYRNETVVYDIKVPALGVVGYLYAPKTKFHKWEYDIVLYPPTSNIAHSFESAQVGITMELCDIVSHQSTLWVRLPHSVQMCIKMLRGML